MIGQHPQAQGLYGHFRPRQATLLQMRAFSSTDGQLSKQQPTDQRVQTATQGLVGAVCNGCSSTCSHLTCAFPPCQTVVAASSQACGYAGRCASRRTAQLEPQVRMGVHVPYPACILLAAVPMDFMFQQSTHEQVLTLLWCGAAPAMRAGAAAGHCRPNILQPPEKRAARRVLA